MDDETPLEELRKLIDRAEHDENARAARESLVRALGPAFGDIGLKFWVGGDLFGSDRVAGRSPFQYGSDAVVGLATVAQTAGALSAGIVLLLDNQNIYGAAALLRQIVEVEYLAWAFAEDEAEAASWLRSTRDERMQRWQPRYLRKRSGGRFRGADYSHHCELGGHPTRAGARLLPGHSALPVSLWWIDLAVHGASTWEYLASAAARVGYSELLETSQEGKELRSALERWRGTEPLQDLVAQLNALRADPVEMTE